MTQLKLTKTQAELKRLTAQVTTLLAENERLNKALKWQQDETGRMGTHCPDCHLFGPRHYKCLLARFKDIAGEKLTPKKHLPEMVQIPGQNFAMGKYPVTFAEWDLYAAETKARRPGDEGWGRGTRPVMNVDWYDATSYAVWLSNKTGKTYRLPTEDEWEYACRAGTTTEYSFGNDTALLGEYAWYRRNSDGKTHPVGEKLPNGFGMYDMTGNVGEWTLSEPERGSRVVRGGSWSFTPVNLRAACRGRVGAASRNSYIGFRLVLEETKK